MRRWMALTLFIMAAVHVVAQKCGDPSALQATSITDHSAVLSWQGAPEHVSYSINVMQGPGSATFKWSTSTSDTTVLVDGLEAGSEYRFKVQASCDKGKGNSGWVSFTTTGDQTTGPGPCPKATNLAVRDVSDSSVVLTWLPSVQHVDFQVDVKSKNQTTSFHFSRITTDSFLMVDGLEAGGNYHFRIKASCDKNSAGSSDWIDFSTTGGDSTFNQCPKPKNLSVLEVTDSSALLSWIIQDSASSFKVDIKSASQTPYFSHTVNIPDTFYLETGLEPMGNYRFRVVATCLDGSTSGSSDWSNFRTLSHQDTSVTDTTVVTDTTRTDSLVAPQTSMETSQLNLKPNKSTKNKKSMADDPLESAAITFYPNPANNQLNVQLPLNRIHQVAILEISNLEGRPVLRRQVKDVESDVLLNVSNLREGMYQLTIRSGTYLESQKIFISHH